MRYRVLAVVAAAVALSVVAATAAASGQRASAHTLTVWLQVDAQNGWPEIVAAANNSFENSHPGWNVNVQYQQWNDHLQKFDATIAGNDTPDVIEMGNTDMTAYMAAHEFASLGAVKSSFDNSSKWLAGLTASSTYNGKLYGVPYYAGSRVITYRTDLFKKAGFKKPPKSLSQFQSELVKVGKMEKHVKGFAPLYVGGEDWFTALSFVFDYNGSIAKKVNGKWVGTLASKKSVAGLKTFKRFFAATQSRSTATLDGSNPFPYTVFSQGRTAANYGPAWYTCCTGKKYAKVVGQFVMPSHTKGMPMPGFLGGSDLGVPIQSNSQAEARAWIADFTSTANEKALEKKGNIPNATNLLGNSVNERAAARSWFIPQAKHWADVQTGNILKTFLAQFLTGHLSVQKAAEVADQNIAQTLNEP
ncbi:MAG TPA: extracellular solute-binding protein [Gaiellaceae bacterium]|jgi:N,N'-diacetylchitobiose transport system substrate-binding protein|nr:extracellular solute-binding protein [Gaiellaceae bacterium]